MVRVPFGPYASQAAHERGLVTRRRLRQQGVSERTIDYWIEQQLLVVVHAGVYRVAGAPVTWEQSVYAAVLAAGRGAAASHRSAARLWGIGEDDWSVVEITVPMPRQPRLHDVVVHRSRDLNRAWTTLRSRIPATNPLRVMLDVGAVVSLQALEDVLDRGLSQRLFGVAAIEWAYNELARPGRRGCGRIRQVLDDRALGADPPDGLLEPRMARLLRDHGLPPAVFQYYVSGVGRVDFAYPERMIVIEVDGYGYHASPSALERDNRRRNKLTKLGWDVYVFTWGEVVRRPSGTAATIAEVLAEVA